MIQTTAMTAPRADFYVYVLFRENGVPFYIGKGHGRRWLNHESEARCRGKLRRHYIIRNMLDRGVEIPKLKLHEGLTETVAHEYEIALIAAIGRGDRGPLVNLSDGGEGNSGSRHSPEGRAQMSITRRGRKQPAGTGAKIAAAKKGIPKPPEFMARLTAAAAAANRGRQQSPEQIAKAAAGLRNYKRTPEHIANQAATIRGKKRPIDAVEKSAAWHRGRKRTPEQRARIGAAIRAAATRRGQGLAA